MIDGRVLLLLATTNAATPVFGLEWRPLGRADLAWVEEGRTSGLAVAELDGAVRPSLSAFFGAWVSNRTAILGSLGIARLTTTTWTPAAEEGGEDTFQSRHWGVVRPEIDVRFAPWGHDRNPSAFLLAGVYGDIPSARDVSNAYTEEEQATADEASNNQDDSDENADKPASDNAEQQQPSQQAPAQIDEDDNANSAQSMSGASGASDAPGPSPEDDEPTRAPSRPADSHINNEQRQALEQWLRQIPDEPGELLRRKFWYEQQQHQEKTR